MEEHGHRRRHRLCDRPGAVITAMAITDVVLADVVLADMAVADVVTADVVIADMVFAVWPSQTQSSLIWEFSEFARMPCVDTDIVIADTVITDAVIADTVDPRGSRCRYGHRRRSHRR